MEPILGTALLASCFGLFCPQEPAGPVRLMVGFKEGRESQRKLLLQQLRSGLRNGASQPDVEVLVDRLARDAHQPDAFLEWLRGTGGRVVRQFWIVNGAVIELPAEAAASLAARPEVSHVEQHRTFAAHIRAATNAANHNADYVQVSLGLRGSGTTLALLDSGVSVDYQGTGVPHPAFSSPGGTRVVHSEGIADPSKINDENGHGTAVAGVALARNWATPPTLSDDGFAPSAKLASYRITKSNDLNAEPGDLIAAWERVLADRARLGISVANCSFKGSPDPTSLAQQALDTLSHVGDVLVITSAGNDGELSHPSAFSQANVNGLAVGAVFPGSHEVTKFSTYGPLPGDGDRFFPDLVAVGAGVLSVPRDSIGVAANSGTSFAAPMVAGTALLVREARPDFDFVDTKAVILNNVQDISAANPTLSRQHYGLGLLRSDLAVEAARNASVLRGEIVGGTDQRQDFPVQVVAGQNYTATLVWARTAFQQLDWDDLDLLVLDENGVLLSGSASPRNVYERARFHARTTGTYTLVVRSGYMVTPRAEFSLAFGRNLGGGDQLGHYARLGESCPGTASDPAAGLILPPLGQAQFGNTRTRVPLAYFSTRLQQAFDRKWFPSGYTVRSLAFRRDQDQGSSPGLQMDLEVYLGYTDKAVDALNTTFDVNPVPGTMIKVFEDSAFDLPGIAGTATPDKFDYVLPLSQPFTVDTTTGRNLLMEVRVKSHTADSKPIANWFDAAQGRGLRRVYTTGNLQGTGIPDDVALVVSFVGTDSGSVEPRLTWEGVPQLADPFAVILRDARPGALAVLLHGRSILDWGDTPLPVDLGPMGAPDCLVYVEPFSTIPLPVNLSGQSRADFQIPNDPALTGTLFFNQFGILDPLANPLGMVMTNAGYGLVGR